MNVFYIFANEISQLPRKIYRSYEISLFNIAQFLSVHKESNFCQDWDSS